ncbi:MAG: Gfo/Idh/MocA family oxidoreductase [Anaerolineae bacterium]|nr:Gfo/Idh/MocA family oxidoreductase [Anaerolineales bacterium]MCQ3971974.1 gfo/Idh/MocA family oxidoreductase [Anaerolineae bacterium]
MTFTPVKTAVIGCGNISSIYLENAAKWDILDLVACADLDLARAESQAAKFNVPRALPVSDVLADPNIELIINLTIPAAHAEIGLAALRAGKSVYNEKPLALSRAEGQLMLREAQARGLRVGNAPDTFLGGGLQTCRQLLDAGEIGTPVAANAFMFIRGPEAWHPDPGFFYQVGAGPLFDMGPYYLTALVSMLGPIHRVTGSARITYPERTIGSGPKQGQKIPVETPTHIAGILDFASGPVATLTTSFDVTVSAGEALNLYDVGSGLLEIQGTTGTLSMPDPNMFGGPVRVRRLGEAGWREIPLTHAYTANSRCLGVADLAHAIRTDRPHRANGDMAFHVLDVMHAILEASETGQHIELTSTCERPAPLPAGLPEHQLEK